MVEENKDFKHIIRVLNTDLDGNKPISHALLKIKGVGFMFANAICAVTGIEKGKKTGYLSDKEVERLDSCIKNPSGAGIPIWMLNRRKDYEEGDDKHLLKTDLDFTQSNDVKRLKMIKSYKGLRHAWGLPVRGQRTKSNFRKNKGKVTSVKKKVEVKPKTK